MTLGNRTALPKDTHRCLARLFEVQRGVVSREQALSAGMSSAGISRRVSSGHWARLLPGVFRLTGVGLRWEQRLMAAFLWGGEGSVISHDSAAALWGFEGFSSGVIDLTVSRDRRSPANWVRLFRRRSLQMQDVRTRHEMRLTSPEQTLLDICAIASTSTAEAVIEEALRRGLTTIQRLRAKAAAAGKRHSKGALQLRHLLDLRGDVPPTESVMETSFARFVRSSNLPTPIRQHRLYSEEGTLVARLDFAYVAQRVAVEVDGYRYHSGRRVWAQDRARSSSLAALGWRIVHVTKDDLLERPQEKAEEIRRALGVHPLRAALQ